MASLTRRSAASPCPRRAAPRRRGAPKRLRGGASFSFKEALLCVRGALRKETEARRASTPPRRAARTPRRASAPAPSRRRAQNTAWRAPGGRRRSVRGDVGEQGGVFKRGIRGTCRGDRRGLRRSSVFGFVSCAQRFLVSWFSDDSRWDATARLAGRRAASVSMLSAASRTRPLANARDARSVSRAATRGLFFPDATTERRFSVSVSVSSGDANETVTRETDASEKSSEESDEHGSSARFLS